MKKFSLFLFVFELTLATTAQKTITLQPTVLPGVSERFNRIDYLLQEYVDKQWIGGATAIVVQNGKTIYHKSFGYKDIDTKTPVTNDAIYRIASQTKAITSSAIMMLYEEGKILLDDPLSKYIPEYKNPKVLDTYNEKDTTYTTVPAKREITIRDLLTHTSGIGYAQIGNARMNAIYYKADVWDGIGVGKIVLADKMKLIATLPLFHQPGEQWTYGLNTDLLGYLVEVVSGMNLDQFFRQKIFDPLEMKDTYFYLPASKKSRLIPLVSEDKDGKAIKAPATLNINGTFYSDYPNTNGTYFSGGGGLSSTAYDYAIFMQMLLNNGIYNGKRILSKASVRMMTSNQIGQLSFRNGNNFGLGFEIVTEEGSAKIPLSTGTFSWGGMFSSTYWIDPKEKIVAQLFINQYPNTHGEIQNKFKMAVYKAIE